MRSLILGCLGALSAGYCPLAGQTKPDVRPFVPGEVILRFKPNSEPAKMLGSSPPGSNQPAAAFVSYLRALSAEANISIRVKQLLSGGSLVLEIDKSALSDRSRDRLRAHPNVQQALATPPDPAAPRPSRIAFQVEFVEKSAEAAAVSKAGPQLQAVAESLSKQTGLPLTAELSPSRQLLLIIDLEALTLDLVARLRKLADVEYAQPNFIHRPMVR